MLILSRKLNESVVVGSVAGLQCLLKVKVLGIRHGSVQLGFETAEDTPVHRSEVWDRITAQQWGTDDPNQSLPVSKPVRELHPIRRPRANKAASASLLVAQAQQHDDPLL